MCLCTDNAYISCSVWDGDALSLDVTVWAQTGYRLKVLPRSCMRARESCPSSRRFFSRCVSCQLFFCSDVLMCLWYDPKQVIDLFHLLLNQFQIDVSPLLDVTDLWAGQSCCAPSLVCKHAASIALFSCRATGKLSGCSRAVYLTGHGNTCFRTAFAGLACRRASCHCTGRSLVRVWRGAHAPSCR